VRPSGISNLSWLCDSPIISYGSLGVSSIYYGCDFNAAATAMVAQANNSALEEHPNRKSR